MLIRKFKAQDKNQVRKICMDTAAESFRKRAAKRELVARMFIDYNVDFEPENCLVAESNGEILGYCAYCTDTEKLLEKTDAIAKSIKNPVYSLFFRACSSTSARLGKKYGGGGFHLNVKSEAQDRRIGSKLLAAMGLHLKSLGFKYMYLVTQNRKTRGYSFYSRYGFTEAQKCGLGSICLTFDLDEAENKAKTLDLCEFCQQ